MNKPRVLLGLSGGVDSSVSAMLLKQQGYEVIACFLKCFSDTKNPLTNECSWREEKRSAQRIAAILKIPFISIDVEKQYKNQVIKPLYTAYEKGLTPNPDIACNTIIKFPWLRKIAEKYKCRYIATGHYARICSSSKGFQLLMGKDKTKDQSYFLSQLTQKDLEKTIFPVGNLTKNQVRKIAEKNKFPNYNKQSTRGICFVGKVNMQTFLKKQLKQKQGSITDNKGNIIGTHPGIQYFTIGQRIGTRLNIILNKEYAQKKYFIAKKIKQTNTIIAVPENHPLLKQKKIRIIKFHQINPHLPLPKQLSARIRHLGKLYKGTLIKNVFTSKVPIPYVAEGQQIVLYKNQELVASGEIRL
jgi:tRNA-specific 2-thiouridylase